ncbi:histidyl-tRNA synthetase 1 [Artemisia annua]|uniref:histidine--tRNA ligase n=1 Tax=Artemisia annua TaxID=35608 RepID=A0A2U1P4I1_ARTAN|nr:histidyl-tRNA synthetase 1 [Artemisia annua]
MASSLVILHPRLATTLRPFSVINHHLFTNTRHHFSSSSSPPHAGRSGSVSAPPPVDYAQKIDVNPPKGTRDFPPEEMRLRNWLFNNFKEEDSIELLCCDDCYKKDNEIKSGGMMINNFGLNVLDELCEQKVELDGKNDCLVFNATDGIELALSDTVLCEAHRILSALCGGWCCIKAFQDNLAKGKCSHGPEVDYPVLETEALYIRKAGEEIRDQLYCFEDRGNRRVALRPELTPSLARLVIQKGYYSCLILRPSANIGVVVQVFHGLKIRAIKSVPLPIKWFAIGQCWRYERMTRGRRREHYQWNMDIIGVPDVTGEAELISSIVTFFKRIGITAKDVGFKISSRKVLQEVLSLYSVPEASFAKACIIIDKMGKIPMEEIKKELQAVQLSNEAIEDLLQVLSMKSLTELEEKLGSAGEAVSELKQLFSLAEKFGYTEWIQFDASVVRGLAYYTGIVFEGFDREGKLRAICGGGRYDCLLSTFGGDDIPACGFGFGDAVIVELLKERKLLPELPLEIENIVCSLDPDLQGAAATVATILRGKGQCVDLVLENKPLKWVFKRAARINAHRLILVGSAEWQRGMVSVKILSTGEQSEVNVDELEANSEQPKLETIKTHAPKKERQVEDLGCQKPGVEGGQGDRWAILSLIPTWDSICGHVVFRLLLKESELSMPATEAEKCFIVPQQTELNTSQATIGSANLVPDTFLRHDKGSRTMTSHAPAREPNDGRSLGKAGSRPPPKTRVDLVGSCFLTWLKPPFV